MSFSRSWLRRPQPEPKSDEQDRWASEPEEEPEREPLIAEGQPSIPAGLKHDPATRMLIEAELKDATAEDRAEWLAFLETVESAEVASLLKERRMSLRRDATLFAENSANAGASSSENVLPTAHSIPAEMDDVSSPASENVQQAQAIEHVNESTETRAEPTAAAGTANWQKKFRSLTDPNWLWSHPGSESPEPEEPAAGSKGDRGPFGLPQIRSSRTELASATAPSRPEPVVGSGPAEKVTAAVEPRMTPGSALWEDETLKLISLLEAEVSSSSQETPASRQEIRKQVALRMLYLAANDPQKSLQVIPGLPVEEQEFWTELFLGLSEHLDQNGVHDPAERATQTIAHLRSSAYHLQQSANLRLRNVAFCQEINGFGNYVSFPTDQFVPGQTVLLYAEIRNFQSVPTEEGQFLTRIRSTIEIYTLANGQQQLVDRSTFEPTEDRSRTLRTDYYHSYRLDLPGNLALGPHLVKLILLDETTGKQSTESIPFLVK